MNSLRERVLGGKTVFKADNNNPSLGGNGPVGLQVIMARADAESASMEEEQDGQRICDRVFRSIDVCQDAAAVANRYLDVSLGQIGRRATQCLACLGFEAICNTPKRFYADVTGKRRRALTFCDL